ncbi:MAG: hypothetical protein AB8G05_00380 [Oligoflexales bacterium]
MKKILEEENIKEDPEVFISENEFYSNLCIQLTGSDKWVYIRGDIKYGTSDFCVMKYEAKRNVDIPYSSPLGLPWVSISQLDAIDTCGALSSNFQLITNMQWMTIASDLVFSR